MELTKAHSFGGVGREVGGVEYIIMLKWTEHNLQILHFHRNTWNEGQILSFYYLNILRIWSKMCTFFPLSKI